MSINLDEPPRKLGSSNCPVCGRWSRITGFRPYYNGNFDCCTMYLTCSKCGPQEIELV